MTIWVSGRDRPDYGIIMSDSESESGEVKRQFLSRYDVFTLVDMIRERPAMWCKTDPTYRDRAARDRCWREILARFEPHSEHLTGVQRQELITILIKKWCNIRDSYRKYICSRSKANSRPYIYADRLTFLDPMFKDDEQKLTRKRKYKYIEKSDTQDTEDNEEPQDEWLNEVQYVDMDDESVKQNNTFQSELSKDLSNSTHDSTVAVLVNLLRKEEDEDRSFFNSILPAVKNLSDENKLEFRIKVMKLLKVFTKREKTIIVKGEMDGLTDSE